MYSSHCVVGHMIKVPDYCLYYDHNWNLMEIMSFQSTSEEPTVYMTAYSWTTNNAVSC